MNIVSDLISDVLKREGWPKVTELPWDRGGLTKGGITFQTYNRWRNAHGDPALTSAEFTDLSEPQARIFLEDEFITPFQFVWDDRVFRILADWAVNAGVDDPAKALQRAMAGVYTGPIDGIPGPATKAAWAAFAVNPDAIARVAYDLVKARILFHFDHGFDADVRAFVQQHQTSQLINLKGWVLRALDTMRPVPGGSS